MAEFKRNFADIPNEFAQLESAKIVLIPVPYDGTSTWGKGADKGPEAFLEAAANMELYDIETDSEVYQKGIYLADAVTEASSPEKMVEAVFESTKKYIDMGKFVTAFGGEHSISIGTIRAFAQSFKDLTVVQIDAHADLRQEFHGSTCNHACAVAEAQRSTNLIQVGIRSMDSSELKHMNKSNVFFAHEIQKNDDWMKDAIKKMSNNVFITIDLDAFDPSILPSTGTPEPGGLSWYQVINFIKKINKKKNIVGFDIVELAPNPQEKASDFVAAKLYYKMLSYKFHA
jgi:agmatinase